MARVQSMGVHRPNALAYLIQEALIADPPPTSSYKHATYPVFDATGKPVGEDEVLQTKTAVVWSRGGVVKRVFNLKIEKEELSHSFITRFPSTKDSQYQTGRKVANDTTALNAEGTIPTPTTDALVVVLNTKVHIFFLTGHAQIVSLPFEVEKAFPTSSGCLFQRRMSPRSRSQDPMTAPHNSFVSSELTSSLLASSQVTLKAGSTSRPFLTLTRPSQKSIRPVSAKPPYVPPVISLTDPQAELGIAVVNTRYQSAVRMPSQVADQPFDPAEEVVYISPKDETNSHRVIETEPLYIAVTRNLAASTYTIWQVRYLSRASHDISTRNHRPRQEKQAPRRRSSMKYGLSGSVTPIGRPRGDSRDSMGPQMGRSFSEKHNHDEPKTSEIESFATELEPVFEQVGVQTRASRRVSSMLARTDLSMGPNRTTGTALASGPIGRKSLGRVGPRGDSVGDIRDRQSFGARPRSSLPGASFGSDGLSFLHTSVDQVLEGLNAGSGFEGFGDMALDDSISDLPTEIAFTKIYALPYQEQSAEARHPLRVFVTSSPPIENKRGDRLAELCIGVMDRSKHELCVIRMEAVLPTHAESRRNGSKGRSGRRRQLELTSIHSQKGNNILDACPLRAGKHSGILCLKNSPEGKVELLLESVESPPISIDLPASLLVHPPTYVPTHGLRRSPSDVGRGRTIKVPLQSLESLEPSVRDGQVGVIDSENVRHSLRIYLEPSNPRVKRVLEVLEFILQRRGSGGLMAIWIEALKWLRSKRLAQPLEWPATVIILFSMIVPLLPDNQGKPRTHTRQNKVAARGSIRKSGSGKANYQDMIQEECGRNGALPPWADSPAWNWTGPGLDIQKSYGTKFRRSAPSSRKIDQESTKPRRVDLILDCLSWTREYLQTTTGAQMLGSEGGHFLVKGRRPESHRTVLGSILVALHLLREEQKLDIRSPLEDHDVQLAPILAQIGRWLNWPDWTAKKGGYYNTEIPNVSEMLFDENTISSPDLIPQPFLPSSIFEFAERSFSSTEPTRFLTLLDVVHDKHITSQEVVMAGAKKLTPRSFSLLEYLGQFTSFRDKAARVKLMLQTGLVEEVLATLPIGISAPFRDALSSCKSSPPFSWRADLLQLVGREDLKAHPSGLAPPTGRNKHNGGTHEATRDYHSIGNSVLDTEPAHAWDASSEADRQGLTRLIFKDDRRFQDASRLVNQLRAPVAECYPEPDWTEADLLDAQREIVQLATLRTLTVSSGRGMMNYSSRIPLLTEKVVIPAFSLQCQVRPSNVTFSADRAAFTEDRAVWAFFHNGTAAGLTISRDAEGIDTSWILYNKPPELTNRHAGFLLALGLNGHLKSLAKWVAFKYLTPKHTMTSIGLLLGLSASYLGTMDTLITRLLSVHVTRMLPPGAAELNLSPLTQTTGIMGIGLLYCSSQHRRMSEVMLSEIENNDVEAGASPEQTLRDEGYRLAAGFALGFINLGQGKALHALHDMNVMERLLSIAISTKNVNLVHILDRATSGATIAFALIYMKTDDETIARKIDIPDTLHQFDYVRPDLFLIRTLARHLIMWNSVKPNFDFICASLPKAYRHRASLMHTRVLSSEDMPFFNILAGLMLVLGLRFAGSGSHVVRDLLTAYLDQFIRLTRQPALNYDAKLTRNALRNCQDVTALALAAVMAGSGDIVVFRRLRSLHGRVDAETPYGSHLAAHMALGILFLGGGTYTLGTSNLAVASLLCAFYPLFPTTIMDNQAHLQAFRHLWVLAAEPRCVITRDVETRRPVSVPIQITMLDPEGEERRLTTPCLIPELDTVKQIKTVTKAYWNVCITFDDAHSPKSRADFKSHPVDIPLRRRPAYDAPRGSVLASEMQALADHGPVPSVSLDPNTQIRDLSLSSSLTGIVSNPFDWLWTRRPFHDLDVSEKDLVLPHLHHLLQDQDRTVYLQPSVVDTRLEIEHSILPRELDERNSSSTIMSDAIGAGRRSTALKRRTRINRDALWQLRLLFAWIEVLEREDLQKREEVGIGGVEGRKKVDLGEGEGGGEREVEGGNWLRREVVERLRWRVWMVGRDMED